MVWPFSKVARIQIQFQSLVNYMLDYINVPGEYATIRGDLGVVMTLSCHQKRLMIQISLQCNCSEYNLQYNLQSI